MTVNHEQNLIEYQDSLKELEIAFPHQPLGFKKWADPYEPTDRLWPFKISKIILYIF